MMGLEDAFSKFPGNTEVFLHVRNGNNDISIKIGQKIALNDYIINMVESMGKLGYKEEALNLL